MAKNGNLKSESRHHNKHQHRHFPGKASGMRFLLLWQIGKANRAPNAVKPTELDAIVTVTVMGDVLEHNCQRWRSSDHSNLRQIKEQSTKKKHPLYKLLYG